MFKKFLQETDSGAEWFELFVCAQVSVLFESGKQWALGDFYVVWLPPPFPSISVLLALLSQGLSPSSLE